MKSNVIEEKSFVFSENIVLTYKELVYNKREYVLSKQLLRSCTSIGANISEAVFGQSQRDFISKMQIARKEPNESLFWIRLMERTGFLETEQAIKLKKEANEIIRILTAIVKTSLAKENK